MNGIRQRLEAHRDDVLVLLEETTRTARLYEGFRLAGAVSHLARAQALLGEELENLAGGSKQEEASAGEQLAVANEDDTPIDGISPAPTPGPRRLTD
ncbi:MAG TPA: hypothetical protein VGX68_23640 [Thermoanaerobaculia bacterium]|jgi:hypothetical protein|nr:hypothetical protein [Thermoanaerobaculia bacterium]